MQARFLLGPAGSGKTFRCLAEIRAQLLASPEGSPLILLAPKQATFQLERQLLADPSLPGYTRLHILSFERLAHFVLESLCVTPLDSLSEEGRVMVLRALLIQRQSDLKMFRSSARLTGFARELSLLFREFQCHHLSPARLNELATRSVAFPQLCDKLHDLALLLNAYGHWLSQHELQDANHLLDIAAQSLRTPHPPLRISAFWLDGFAEMTPQELDLLAALMPCCEQATLAFCLDPERTGETSWLSPWSVVSQIFSKCRARLASLPGVEVVIEALKRDPVKSRFAGNSSLRHLETNWDRPAVHHASRITHHETLQLVACANPEAEAVLAAREILHFVRAGGRFRQCAVIVRSLEPCHATLARVFRRYGIPFFLDRRESVSHHPLAELTRFAVRAVAFGWRHDDWFGALKSGLVPAREDELDWLENAALQFGWQGNAWQQTINLPVNASLAERAEHLRQKIIRPFAALAEQTAAPITGVQLGAALRELWSSLDVQKTLERWATGVTDIKSNIAHRREPSVENPGPGTLAIGDRSSAIHQTVWEQAESWLENLERAFFTEALSLREWLPILEAGLAHLTVGVIPPALDQVLIGAIDRSRNPDLKLACVLGLNEGIFPAPPTPGALLTDAERAGLEGQGVFLGPTAHQCLGRERYYGYIACTRSSQRLVLTRATRNAAGQPLNSSPLFEHVKQIAGVEPVDFNGPDDWRQSEHVCELAAPVLRAVSDQEKNAPIHEPPPHPALSPGGGEGGVSPGEGVITVQRGSLHSRLQIEALLELGQLPALAPLVLKWRQWADAATLNRLSAPMSRNLYGQELQTSVSGLEEFAACPFKFFAARGLRLEERKEFQFDDRDKGSFQHEVLREFHRRVHASGRMWRHLSVVEARVMIASIAEDFLAQFEDGKFQATGAARFAGEVLTERLADLVETLIGWMIQYDFDPALAEIGFGLEPDGLPAWRLQLPNGCTLRLRGRIDRVDLYRPDDDTALAVVMDYKSRPRKLNATKLQHGLELQLLSYLGVLQCLKDPKKFFGVKQLVPVGVFYVPLNGGGARPGRTRTEVVTAGGTQRRMAHQHSGLFREDALGHLDNRRESRGDQFKYALRKDDSFAARGNDAIPAEEFDGLRQKIEAHLHDYAQRIVEGEVTVSPFRIGQQTACDYCDFRAVCRFDPWVQPYRTLRPSKPMKTNQT